MTCLCVCMFAYVCIGAYVFRGTYKWKFAVDVGSLFGSLSTLYIEAGAFPQTYRSPIQLASLANHLVLRVPCLCPENTGIRGGSPQPSSIYGHSGDLNFGLCTCCLRGECFKLGAVFPVP